MRRREGTEFSRGARVLGVLISVLVGWLLFVSAEAAVAAPACAEPAYADEGFHRTSLEAHTTTERDPSAAYDHAADRWSCGAVAHADPATRRTTYGYDDNSQPEEVAQGGRLPDGRTDGPSAARVVAQRSEVAAEGGSRIALNQAAGNAARDAISAAHPAH